MSRARPVHDERGASAVMVALVMVLLLGFAAVAIDVAALFSERQKLQLGADAAALAIAKDCAQGNCGPSGATAQKYVSANSTEPTAAGSVLTPSLSPSTGQVTVQAAATTPHWFAPILGIDKTSQTVQATAAWGGPEAGPAMLPLAFSLCEWLAQTGGGVPSTTTPVVIETTKTSETGCTGRSGNIVPGGFGWVVPDVKNGCVVTSRRGDWLSSDNGNDPACDADSIAEFRSRIVMLPIFDAFKGSGSNAKYQVLGYAAFRLTGYKFASPERYIWNNPCPKGTGSTNGNNARCIAGYFVQFVASTDWELGTGGPDFGARVVRLTG